MAHAGVKKGGGLVTCYMARNNCTSCMIDELVPFAFIARWRKTTSVSSPVTTASSAKKVVVAIFS
eukprot:scaffold38182_cov35-Tisochrysis_lutea.AAC.2